MTIPIPELAMVFVDKKTYLVLMQPYELNYFDRNIYIPSGFTFDGTSAPRRLWHLVGHPFEGKQVIAALVHDYLYSSEIVSRAEADDIYLQLLLKLNQSKLKSYMMYLGVRIFGGLHYGKKN